MLNPFTTIPIAHGYLFEELVCLFTALGKKRFMIIELKERMYSVSLPTVIPLDMIAKVWVVLTMIPSAADNLMNKAGNAFRPPRT